MTNEINGISHSFTCGAHISKARFTSLLQGISYRTLTNEIQQDPHLLNSLIPQWSRSITSGRRRVPSFLARATRRHTPLPPESSPSSLSPLLLASLMVSGSPLPALNSALHHCHPFKLVAGDVGLKQRAASHVDLNSCLHERPQRE